MELKIIFSIIWIILTLGAFAHYFWSIWKWKTKPHVFTWLIFSILLGISFFIQRDHGGWVGTWVLAADFICCFIAFIVAIKYWEKNITFSDKIFLTGAVLSIIAWLIFKAPYISTMLITLIDFFALLPTYRKCWNKPQEETIVMYFVSGCIFLFSLLAIENYSFLTTWHQAAIILFDWWLVLYIVTRRKMLQK